MIFLVALVASLTTVVLAILFLVSVQDGNYVTAAMLAVMLFAILVGTIVAWQVTVRGIP